MKWWKKITIIIFLVIGILLLFNNVIMPFYVKQNKLVKVPKVVGLNYNDAKKVLDDADLEGIQGDIRYDATKSIGTILDQNPPPDQVVKSGRRIYLIVSGGEQLYEVPNLVGRNLHESKFVLAQRNLELQELSSKQSAQYPSGTILSQVEQPGSKVKKSTKIGVIVSSGFETGNIRVPDLIGKSLDEAKKIIIQNHLIVGKINFQPSTSNAVNSVIDQFPKGNTLTNENQKIDLFVNKKLQKEVPKDEEMNSLEEVKPEKEIDKTKTDEKLKETDKDKKTDVKKDTKIDTKKGEKTKEPDKKSDKKKSDKPKDKDKNDDGGTQF